MRFYTQQHSFYCGIDLHARTMYVCILSAEGESIVERNIPTRPERLLRLIAPYRQGLVIGVECMFSWFGGAGPAFSSYAEALRKSCPGWRLSELF